MISVSLLSSYMYCPRKVFLDRVLKLVEVPKEVVLRGSIRHIANDNASKAEESIVKQIEQPLSSEEIKQLYENKYRKLLNAAILQNRPGLKEFGLEPEPVFTAIWPSFTFDAAYRAKIVHNFMLLNRLCGVELWQKLVPKIRSEFYVESARLNLCGKIDRLEDYGSSSIPVELKTGRAPKEGLWPGHRVQVAGYIMLLEENNAVVSKGVVSYVEDGSTRDVIMNPFMRKEVIELKEKVEKLLKAENIPEKLLSEAKCMSCGVREKCFAQDLNTEVP